MSEHGIRRAEKKKNTFLLFSRSSYSEKTNQAIFYYVSLKQKVFPTFQKCASLPVNNHPKARYSDNSAYLRSNSAASLPNIIANQFLKPKQNEINSCYLEK